MCLKNSTIVDKVDADQSQKYFLKSWQRSLNLFYKKHFVKDGHVDLIFCFFLERLIFVFLRCQNLLCF